MDNITLSIFSTAFENHHRWAINLLENLPDEQLFRAHMLACHKCEMKGNTRLPLGNWKATSIVVVKSPDSMPFDGAKHGKFLKAMNVLGLPLNDVLVSGLYQCELKSNDYKPASSSCLLWLREVIHRDEKLQNLYLLGRDPCDVLLSQHVPLDSDAPSVYTTLLETPIQKRQVKIYAYPSYLRWRK